MPLPLLASTKLKNRTFILLYLIYICTVFLYYLNHCRVGYVRLKPPLNEVDTYTFLHYTWGTVWVTGGPGDGDCL